MRLEAKDRGSPPRSSTALYRIQVVRNVNSPVFSLLSYEQQILNTLPVYTEILQVSASDSDLPNAKTDLEYTLTGYSTDLDFFELDKNGKLRLAQSVQDVSTKNVYYVSTCTCILNSKLIINSSNTYKCSIR